jgi:hypothetical protein
MLLLPTAKENSSGISENVHTTERYKPSDIRAKKAALAVQGGI